MCLQAVVNDLSALKVVGENDGSHQHASVHLNVQDVVVAEQDGKSQRLRCCRDRHIWRGNSPCQPDLTLV